MMYKPEIEQAIERYHNLEKHISRERTCATPLQSNINHLEAQMAKIEDRFQKSGLDINDYL